VLSISVLLDGAVIIVEFIAFPVKAAQLGPLSKEEGKQKIT
jgi:hypothetical protein